MFRRLYCYFHPLFYRANLKRSQESLESDTRALNILETLYYNKPSSTVPNASLADSRFECFIVYNIIIIIMIIL